MSNVWYNKYRPQDFDQVIGQELAVRVLSNAIKTNKIKNGYLLTGSRGVGKTTIARIFANSLNDIKTIPDASIDIFEMDAASNTSVDDVRLLIENASTPPLLGKYKVFIIDEVHMLSKSAMNALLKILEEPPVYLVFVLATTNPEKILPTVLSRLIKLDLSDHTPQELITNLQKIAKSESISIDLSSLELIAKKANGGQRDAINYLQTVAEYDLEEYNPSTVGAIIGVMPDKIFKAFVTSVKSKNSNPDYKKLVISNLNKLQITPLNLINQTLTNLLDAHFEGNSQDSDLIDILADYSSKNLPITNVVEVMSYLDFKYSDKKDLALIDVEDITKPLKTKAIKAVPKEDIEINVEPKTQKKTEPLVQIPKIEEANENKAVIEVAKNEETLEFDDSHEFEDLIFDEGEVITEENNIEIKKVEIPQVIQENEVESITNQPDDLESINKIIANLKKNKKAPISLTQSLEVLSVIIKDDQPTLISQDPKRTSIISDEDVEFLDSVLESLLGNPIKLVWNGGVPKPTPKPVKSENTSLQTSQTFTTAPTEEKHFYEVYGSRPEGVPIEVPVTSTIPSPKKTTSTDVPNSDEEGGVHDLFDI
jgi:DNA polymerase III subunit gamma/tau